MRNPTNARNEPVCPICARGFAPSDAVMRTGENGCMVHLVCIEEADLRDDPCARSRETEGRID